MAYFNNKMHPTSEFIDHSPFSIHIRRVGRAKDHRGREPHSRQPVRPHVPRVKPGREGDRGGVPELRRRVSGRERRRPRDRPLSIAPLLEQQDQEDCLRKVTTSVTRWLDYLFNIWLFR